MQKYSYPFIATDYWITISDIVILQLNIDHKLLLNEIEKIVDRVPIIFIHTNYIYSYIPLFESVSNKFIVISTNNFDVYFPFNNIQDKILNILSKNNLIKWFAINSIINHPKIQAIPIGPKYQWTSTDFFGENKIMMNNIYAKYCSTPEQLFQNDKENLLYFNYDKKTTTSPYYTQHQNIRIHVYNILSNRFTFLPNQPFENYIQTLSTYKFSICPPGNGIDTHRAWESLMMGTIPIMMHTPIDNLFDDLPVVFIDDWNIITEEFLNNKYKELRNKKYNFNKCYCDYWHNYIKNIYILK
jgi:hypothetical protein